MKTAVIIHGKPSREEYFDPDIPSQSNCHWLPWLQKFLLLNDYVAQTPEMPNPYAPHYPSWRREFERFDITARTILVGHSCGAGFLVRWLSEHRDVKVGQVVLVAPWLDPRRNQAADFFDFKIDPDLPLRTSALTIFNSDDDGDEVQDSVAYLTRTLRGANYREFQGYGHFCYEDMGTVAFPELLEAVLSGAPV